MWNPIPISHVHLRIEPFSSVAKTSFATSALKYFSLIDMNLKFVHLVLGWTWKLENNKILRLLDVLKLTFSNDSRSP